MQTHLDNLLATTFPKQREFIEEKEQFIAALCSRRAGKTEGAAIRLIKQCLLFARSNCIYLALTRDSARLLMYRKIDELNLKHGLGLIMRRNKLEVHFPNGSMIKMLGMDGSPHEVDKLLGQKYDEAIVDEAASFRISLDDLVKKIKPCLIDRNGTLILIGSPQHLTRNLFWKITRDEELGWKKLHWTWEDNPHIAPQAQAQLNREIKLNPNYKQTPDYFHSYAGDWFLDSDLLVYHINPERNILEGEPLEAFERARADYMFFAGVDIGFRDATSVTVLAVNLYSRVIIVILSQKRSGKNVTEIGEILKDLHERFDFVRIWMDTGGSGKIAESDLVERFQLPLEAAEKQNKLTFISFVNDDFGNKNLMLLPEHTEPLIEEAMALSWDKKHLDITGKYRENPQQDNHCCDSLLYAYRAARHYQELPADQAPQRIVGVDAVARAEIIAHAQRSRADRYKMWFDNTDETSFNWLFANE